MELVCSLCGVSQEEGYQIDGAHVKSKRGENGFSDEEVEDGIDRMMNIIPLCVEHHRLFDSKKGLGIVEVEEGEDLYFARSGCCSEGICVRKTSHDVFRNTFLMRFGKGEKVKREYILQKNSEIRETVLFEFCKDFYAKSSGIVFSACKERKD